MTTTKEVIREPRRQGVAGRTTGVGRFIELQDRVLRRYGVKAESRHVRIARPAMRVHLLVAGRGRPAVILHGGDGEAVNWAPLLAELQSDTAAYAADRPGFGLSDPFDYRRVNVRRHAADFVRSLLDALDLERATVIGGSMGGFFGLCATLAHPARVDRLVLVGMPAGFSREAPDSLKDLVTIPGRALEFMNRASTLEGQHEQYRHMFQIDPSTIPDVYFRARVAGVNLPGVKETWATLLRRLCGPDGIHPQFYLGDELARIERPVLTIWGGRDMAPVALGRDATERIPHGRFVSLSDVGHFPFLEAPAETAKLIREFMAE